jgi:hypothetical protein
VLLCCAGALGFAAGALGLGGAELVFFCCAPASMETAIKTRRSPAFRKASGYVTNFMENS